MATPVSDIYDLFLSQIGKDLMLEMADDIVDELLMTYLLGATVEFSLICKKDLTIENKVTDIVEEQVFDFYFYS